MLIQHVVRTACALLILSALGFGAAEAGAVGVGLLCRLIARGALLESLEIDHVAHDRPHHATGWQRVTFPHQRERLRRASVGSITIRKIPRYAVCDNIKNDISLCESDIFSVLYHDAMQRW